MYFWLGRSSIAQWWAQISIRCLHYPICITSNWWPSVNAELTDIVRTAPCTCHFLFCTYWMVIYWLWIPASKSLTNYLIYKTKHCGASIDAWGVAAWTETILPIKVADTSNMDKCRSTALGLYKMQHRKLLTLCWRSVSDRCCDNVTIAFAHNGCQYVDYGHMP
jgi:hypothetical protein